MGSRAFHPVMIRPSLGFAMVPRPRKDRADGDPSARPRNREEERAAAVLAVPGVSPAGLVEGPESDAFQGKACQRQGLAGLTRHGAAVIEDLCSVVRQDRGLYAIWTVTLPPEAAAALSDVRDGGSLFGDTLRRRFGEALTRACSGVRFPVCGQRFDHWWFVVEPQKNGNPHWHFVFRCKPRRGKGWLLGKGRLDRLIRSALTTVTGKAICCKSAGNVQALRTDPGRYLSKYLRKGTGKGGGFFMLEKGASLNLVPKRWWGCSSSARHLLNRYRFELPGRLVDWLSLQWPKLSGIGLIEARIWEPEAEGAPRIVVGSWKTADALIDTVVHLFDLSERAYPSGVVLGIT
jgi:hypothetical protein